MRSLGLGLSLAAAIAAWSLAAACSSPTQPSETLFLEGQLMPLGSETHPVALRHSGVTKITVDDLRKVLWDVTAGDVTPAVTLGVGSDRSGACNVTGQLVIREGDVYFWSMQEGARCFVFSDSGSIPADGVLAYNVRLDLPG